MNKQDIIMLVITIIILFGILFIGFKVMKNVGNEIKYLLDYCKDKEGDIDISNLNLSFYEEDVMNCTKCNQGQCFTEAIAY